MRHAATADSGRRDGSAPARPLDAFQAPWWIRSGHLQTVWPSLVRRRSKGIVHRQRVELPDGDFLDIDWAGSVPDDGAAVPDVQSNARSGTPIVLILHGLEGSSRSPYACGLLAALRRRGLRAGVMHFRSCSGEMNRLPRSYHSGETGDLEFVLGKLGATDPSAPLAAVGFSLGGNVLLKWLGERGVTAPIRCAAAVSVPFELGRCADRLERGLSRVYGAHLLRSLKHKTLAKAAVMPTLAVDVEHVKRAATLREFDDRVTAPVHGFAGAADYYGRCSARQFLGAIARPTLLLHAADDPFMSPDVVPHPHELSATSRLELGTNGGHVGFVSGANPFRPAWWLEHRICEFLCHELDLGT